MRILQNIKVFSIVDNPLLLITPTTFGNLMKQQIESDDYRIYCIVPSETKCNAHRPFLQIVCTCSS